MGVVGETAEWGGVSGGGPGGSVGEELTQLQEFWLRRLSAAAGAAMT